MKNSIQVFAFCLLIVTMLSCAKDADPALEIYVSAKKSDMYTSIEMSHGNIRMFEGENSAGNLQMYNGLDINLDLTTSDNSVLVGDLSHWEGSYVGVNAYLSNIKAINDKGVTINAMTLITAAQQIYGNDFELLKNERYRMDFVYDVDASILLQETQDIFDPVVEVTVTKL